MDSIAPFKGHSKPNQIYSAEAPILSVTIMIKSNEEHLFLTILMGSVEIFLTSPDNGFQPNVVVSWKIFMFRIINCTSLLSYG